MTDVLILSEPLSYNELFNPAADSEMIPAESCHKQASGARRSKHRVGRTGRVVFLRHVVLFDQRKKSHVRVHDGRYVASLLDQMREMNVTRLFVTDVASKVRWELIARTLDERHPLKKIPVENLRKKFGDCPICSKNCVRWVAVSGISCIRKV
ncbi:hypothetical protein AVEN_180733-1 [Araneus ventricosus]|uniref:Uncharacterized protein n=1 Tax=Araneus ventricosus TaxID=182803 RepID=A0A4Y2FZM9_ARAVE|nr:hypothetical protein AVEN_180733-1 [Araneus ventricosus]